MLVIVVVASSQSVSEAFAQAALDLRIQVGYAGCVKKANGGWFIVSGEVTNEGLSLAGPVVKVTGTFYGPGGSLLFTGSDFTDPPLIPVQFSAAFTIAVDSIVCDHVVSYRLAAGVYPDFGYIP